MARRLYANNATTTLAADIAFGATSLTVATGDGAKFPTIAGGDWFLVTIYKLTGSVESLWEVVKVTARTGDSFGTIVRAQEGTTARNWTTGDRIEIRATGASFDSGELSLQKASNLSDLAAVATARTNLGLGDAAQVTLSASNRFVTDAEKSTWNAKGVGTVTSVGASVPTGLSISGTPVTNSGTLAITLTAGYVIPTTASATNWDTAYTDRNKWDGGATGLTAATGRTSLGATTVGGNMFTLTNPSAITFLRVNADNTLTALDASSFRTAIGAGTSSTTGTVTSVGGTGTVSGMTLSGTVTGSGNLTLGGTLSLTTANVTSVLASATLTGDIAFGNYALSGLKTAIFNGEVNNGNSGSSITINFATGQKQKLTMTAACTVTISGMPGVGHYQLRIIQNATGNYAVTWAGISGSRWLGATSAPAVNLTANGETIVTFFYDGTSIVQSLSKVGAV
jgi:hypothetical protein